MSAPSDQHQVDIFSNDTQQKHFAELCNALYERELFTLSQQKSNNVHLLQRRLGGLSHHIRRAAEHLLNHQAPIDVDIHNASWQAKQAATCMIQKADMDKTRDWFALHARMGLVVPVYLMETGVEHLELDSVDRIVWEEQRLHLNKNGWFQFDGSCPRSNSDPLNNTRLLVPAKASLSAACCGHSWNHKGKYQPRTLTLRELLLSSQINWKTFK